MLFDFIKRFFLISPTAGFFPPVGGGGQQGYQIGHALRLRSANSAYLSRTFGTPTSNTTWSLSMWVKRGALSSSQALFSPATTDEIYFDSSNLLGLYGMGVSSTSVFRDPSAHGHLHIRSNGTNIKAYWNNVEIASYTGTRTAYNSAVTHYIGRYFGGPPSDYFDGLISDVHFVDGQALTPSSFGQTDVNGVWVPKAYTGTYGNNGFHLDFTDATSLTTLGYDHSGNGNHWTCNGISLTAGVTYDWLTDTPTNNYPTLNPLDKDITRGTLADANLRLIPTAYNTYNYEAVRCSQAVTSGKWYFEFSNVTYAANGNRVYAYLTNIAPSLTGVSVGAGTIANYLGAHFSPHFNNVDVVSGNYGASPSSVAAWAAYANGDIIGFAIDLDAGKFWISKNGTWYNSGDPAAGTGATCTFTSQTGTTNYIGVEVGTDGTNAYQASAYVNFGQRPFGGTKPSGFKALCTANLPAVAIPNPKKHFDAITRTGTGASASVTGVAFSPDFVWGKSRSNAYSNWLYDRLRGTNRLVTDSTGAEADQTTGGVTSFNTDGFSLGGNTTENGNGATFVSWLWKANGAGVSNTAGSITSTVSANTLAGFSIVAYTGTGANATVGHGLGVAPKLIITKVRDAGTTESWGVYHASLGAANAVYLNLTNASAASTNWNSTTPTSSVFSIGNATQANSSGKGHVAYCFAEVPGYSKIGSYTGNGSTDGPFVYCGFRPRYVLIKRTDTGGAGFDWFIWDTARDTYNQMSSNLTADQSVAEGVTAYPIDAVSNGFKPRHSATAFNASGGNYIFYAIAEFPSGGLNVSPCPAR